MITIKLFGITREIAGSDALTVAEPVKNVRQLLAYLHAQYPRLAELNSLMVAVNDEYATDETPVSASDEVALIPPVSGG